MFQPLHRHPCKAFILFFIIIIIGYFTIAPESDDRIWQEECAIFDRRKTDILEEIRVKIIQETAGNNWTSTGVRSVEELVLESGGRPHRTLIVAGWRTGSTFFGEIMSRVPGSYYYYEPLRYLPTMQIRGEPLAATAVKIFKNIFNCKHYDVGWNFVKEKEMGYNRRFNESLRRIWEYVGGDLQLILDPLFMERVCRLFPFQIVKELAVRLDAWKELIEDEDLHLNVVILVRDPRGIIQSRRHDDDYCTYEPECIRPEYLCADMISDFYAAATLAKKFPDRIRVIRFEDLAANPQEVTEKLLDSLRIDTRMLKPMEQFLQTHTKKTDAKQRLVRNSTEVAFKWRTLLDFEEIEDIQLACRGAMELWGYLPAYSQAHLTSDTFKPVGEYALRERH